MHGIPLVCDAKLNSSLSTVERGSRDMERNRTRDIEIAVNYGSSAGLSVIGVSTL